VELLEQGGLYARLYNEQFASAAEVAELSAMDELAAVNE
jgi:hypothetical protein